MELERLRSRTLPQLAESLGSLKREFPLCSIELVDVSEGDGSQIGLSCNFGPVGWLRLMIAVAMRGARTSQVDAARVFWSGADENFATEVSLFIQPVPLDASSLAIIESGLSRLMDEFRGALLRGGPSARHALLPRLDRPRVKVLFEDVIETNVVPLSKVDEVFDSSGQRIVLSPGMRLHLCEEDVADGTPGYLLASGIAELNVPPLTEWSRHARWVCRIDEWGELFTR